MSFANAPSASNKTLRRKMSMRIGALMLFCTATPLIGGTLLFSDSRLFKKTIDMADINVPVAAIIALLAVLCALVAYMGARKLLDWLFDGIDGVRRAADVMAQGRLMYEPEYRENDELGELYKSVSRVGAVVRDSLEDFSHTLDKMARGDFPASGSPSGINREGDYTRVTSALSTMTESLHQVFLDIDAASRMVMDGSFQVANNSSVLSAGVASQRAALESLDNSVRLLKNQSAKNSTQSAVVRRMATECRDGLKENNKQSVKQLSSAEEISRMLTELEPFLSGLHEQCSKAGALSLNACVSFGRRGKLGKQVASICSDICDLTDAGLASIKSLRDALSRAQDAAERGKRLCGYSLETVRRLSESADKAAQSAARVGHASASQTHTIELAQKQVQAVSDVVKTNAAVAEQNTAFSEELASQSQILSRLVTHFYAQAAVPPKEKRARPGERASGR